MRDVHITPLRGLLWALLSFALFVAALFAMLPVLAFVRWFIDLSHLTEMALWPIVWGGLSIVGVLVAARITLGGWLRLKAPGLIIAVIGIGLSATVHVVLQQWELIRFGITEPEYVGFTAVLFAALVGLAVAAFGVFVAPRNAVVWPLIAALVGAIVTLAIIATNVPGLGDGIDPESWPLAIWIGLSGLYAVVAPALAVRRASSASGEPRTIRIGA